MCGLCGELFFSQEPVSEDCVNTMKEALASRGPDSEGSFRGIWTVLGHRRLKIIDISDDSNQPLIDPTLGLIIVFNGAIYNYRELRRDLEERGYKFMTSGDTEVILKAYHAWGEDCVKRFNGMFAFAIYSQEKDTVFLARDRLGIKPLYFCRTPDSILFASTLPALLKTGKVEGRISARGLHHYLMFHSVVPAPDTLIEGVLKLPPASTMTVGPDGTATGRSYWNLSFERDNEEEGYSFEDWKRLVAEGLLTSVKRRLVADVPVGVLLSGGLDSSLVVGLLAEAGQTGLKTFSIGFESVGDREGDEFVYSDMIAQHFGTDHHKIVGNTAEVLPSLTPCVAAMSEPMVSHDCIGFYLLSREVAQHVKVVQSGQGADEIFGGYHWYPPMMESSDPVADYRSVFCDRPHSEYLEIVSQDYHTDDVSTRFIERHFATPGATAPIDKALRIDSTVMLVEDPVKRVDNMTMAWGLEARVPFLDHEFVELAARIPAEHKVAKGGKHILKEAARSILPAAVIDRPKGYFPVPALTDIQGDYLTFVKKILKAEPAQDRGILNPDYVEALLADPAGHITPLNGSKLWQVAVLEFWLQQNGL